MKYLSNGMIRGIGPIYARKLVEAFCEQVLDVFEMSSDCLRGVNDIGPARAKSITSASAEQKAVRQVMMFLHSQGVGTCGLPESTRPMARTPSRS